MFDFLKTLVSDKNKVKLFIKVLSKATKKPIKNSHIYIEFQELTIPHLNFVGMTTTDENGVAEITINIDLSEKYRIVIFDKLHSHLGAINNIDFNNRKNHTLDVEV